jgi:hypothetical protein
MSLEQDPVVGMGVNGSELPDAPSSFDRGSSDPTPSTPSEPVTFEGALRDHQAAQAAAAPAGDPTNPLPAAPPAAPPSSAVLTKLAQYGLSADQFPDEDTALRYLVERAQQYEQVLPWANIGRQVYPHREQFNQYLAGQQAPAAPPAPAPAPAQPESFDLDAHFKKHWDVPEYDPSWEKLVTLNPQTGLFEPVSPGVMPSVVDAANKYAATVRAKQRELLANPLKVTYQGLVEPLKREILREIEQRQEQQTHIQQITQFEQQYAPYIYQTDANGQVLVDPFTNQPTFSAFGHRFAQHVQDLREAGMTNPLKIQNKALELATFDLLRVQQQQQLQAPPPAPAAPPAAPAPTPAQASAQQTRSFLDNALARAAHNPSAGGPASGAIPSEPVVRSWGDLESGAGFFANEAKRLGVIR